RLRRHARRERHHDAQESVEDVPDAGAAAPLASLLEGEASSRLWQSVAALPAGERAAVVLHYRDEMPVRDVARTLGVTSGTIKTLLFRARRHLRERLAGAGPESE